MSVNDTTLFHQLAKAMVQASAHAQWEDSLLPELKVWLSRTQHALSQLDTCLKTYGSSPRIWRNEDLQEVLRVWSTVERIVPIDAVRLEPSAETEDAPNFTWQSVQSLWEFVDHAIRSGDNPVFKEHGLSLRIQLRDPTASVQW